MKSEQQSSENECLDGQSTYSNHSLEKSGFDSMEGTIAQVPPPCQFSDDLDAPNELDKSSSTFTEKTMPPRPIPLSSAYGEGKTEGPSPIQRTELSMEEAHSEVEGDIPIQFLAFRVAYATSITSEIRQLLQQYGYGEPVTHTGSMGFSLKMIPPLLNHSNPPVPVAVFVGTNDMQDILVDMDVEGIGMRQFQENRRLINTAMESIPGQKVFTGHSLGGALAQIAACLLDAGECERVVTFQSPGISQDLVHRFQQRNERMDDPIESTHHRVRHDVVSEGGEAFLPGQIYEYDMDEVHNPSSDELENVVSAHMTSPLTELDNRRRRRGPGIRTSRTSTARESGFRPFESLRVEVFGLENPGQYANLDLDGLLSAMGQILTSEIVQTRMNRWMNSHASEFANLSSDHILLMVNIITLVMSTVSRAETVDHLIFFLTRIPTAHRQRLQGEITNQIPEFIREQFDTRTRLRFHNLLDIGVPINSQGTATA